MFTLPVKKVYRLMKSRISILGLALTLLVTTLLFVASPALAQMSIDDQIAMKFYPASLDSDFRNNHAQSMPPNQLFTSLRVDFDRTGNNDYLAVAYFNGYGSLLRILKGTTVSTAVFIAESQDRTMGGRGQPVLEQTDIDNDGVPEITLRHTHATWVFKYTSGSLLLFGPTRVRKASPIPTTDLGSASFIDIDGDGVLEILDEAPTNTGILYNVWRLGTDGKFSLSGIRAAFVDRFLCGTAGSPPGSNQGENRSGDREQTRSFTSLAGDYTLRVVNGDQNGRFGVTSLDLNLNGVIVATKKDFAKGTRTITIPVKLLARNTLTVEFVCEENEADPGYQELSVTIFRGQ